MEDAEANGALIITKEELARFDKRTKRDAPREITFGVGGEHHEFTAKPPHLHLGSKDEAKTLFGRDAEAAAQQVFIDGCQARFGWHPGDAQPVGATSLKKYLYTASACFFGVGSQAPAAEGGMSQKPFEIPDSGTYFPSAPFTNEGRPEGPGLSVRT